MATSSSSGSSSSTSEPTVINTPASDWELQLAQLLQQMGSQQYQWALNEYARAGTVTDAQINNFLAQAQQGSDLAGGLLSRYQDLYAPMEDQYAREAGSYASLGRQQHEMGAAESRAAQAQNAAKINAEQELESFGIDPSSGRYQDLVRASNTQGAAAAAAAGEEARRATEAEGMRRREAAISMGQQIPGQTVNALNAAYQGISGAENAALGLANTGVNLTTSPKAYFDPAMSLKYPPVGQRSQSQSSQGSMSSSPGGGAGGGGSSAGSKSPAGGKWAQSRDSGGGGGGGYRGVVPGSQAINTSGSYRSYQPGSLIKEVDPYGQQTNMYGDPMFDPSMDTGFYDPSGFNTSDLEGIDWSQYGGTTGQDFEGYDPYSDYGGYGGDYGNTQDFEGYDPYSDYGASDAGWGDTSSYASDPYADYGGDYYMGDSGSASADYGGDYYMGDSGGDTGGDYGYGDGFYARGGAVPQRPMGGGAIPAGMSPSGGRRTDDVPAQIPQTGGQAQLNVGEFVIPKDVALWKGQEFFQKMIAQSRKARMGAPAKPTNGPARGGFNG